MRRVNRLIRSLRAWLNQQLRALAKPVIQDVLINEVLIFGPPDRVRIASSAEMVNALFNTVSGMIEIGEFTFAGHNVCFLTGTHDYNVIGRARMLSAPNCGHDIVVGHGVWLGSNCIIVGPCRIGDHAVVAAGSVVIRDVAPNTMVAGVPARIVKHLVDPALAL